MSAAPKLRLYEATEQLDTVRDWLIEAGGELTPEIEALLGEAQEAFKVKAERVALFIQELLATAAAVKQERERLEKLEKSYTTGAANLKRYLQAQMELAQVEKVEGELVKIRLQNNPPSVRGEVAPEMLHEMRFGNGGQFVRTIPERLELDKRAVIEAWKADASIADFFPPGLEVVQTRSVRIV
jgi:hypothetical protein